MSRLYLLDYIWVNDIACLFVTILIFVIGIFSRREQNRRDKYFKINLFWLASSCCASILYHSLAPKVGEINEVWIYIAHNTFYICLLLMFFMYSKYLRVLFNVEKDLSTKLGVISTVTFIGGSIFILTSNITHFGFYIENNIIYKNNILNGFTLAYTANIILIGYLILKYNTYIVREIFEILVCVVIASVGLMVIQELFLNSAFTNLTFLFPAIAIFYCLHSSSYDLNTGTLPISVLDDNVKNNKEYITGFIFLELFGFDPEMATNDFRSKLFHFNDSFFKRPSIYSFTRNRFILVFDTKKTNPYLKDIEKAFMPLYDEFKLDFKVIFCGNGKFENVQTLRNFVNFIRKDQELNTFYEITDETFKIYKKKTLILNQLTDISNKKDLNDERVLVYCQPVLNLKTKKYTTAEALMRLNIPELGIVYPDEFIPLAEEFDLIHTLTNIILNKTCLAIKQIIKEGFYIERISINYSIMDIGIANFKQEFLSIIDQNKIPIDKIAIELTETQNDYDFKVTKSIIDELSNYNIKFYLDDYGTGYSNFDRILELPFNIIKFDKSLLYLSKKDEGNYYMIDGFSKIFKKLGYSTLFEGVEDLEDEDFCIGLDIDYLQGFKYSKPIPIENLKDFLDKSNA